MGSHLLCNVVLHFLQRHPSRRDPKQYAATSLGHLLFDFLKYYGQEFRMAVLRNLFHHGFHCLCHLFVSRAPPEASMLCPLLLDPAHAVITDRHKLMVEQPVAFPGLKRQLEEVVPPEEDASEPPTKRQKMAGSDFAEAFGDET